MDPNSQLCGEFLFLSMNKAQVNFYVHCLTSTLFRKEFLQLVRINKGGGETSGTAPKHMRRIHAAPSTTSSLICLRIVSCILQNNMFILLKEQIRVDS